MGGTWVGHKWDMGGTWVGHKWDISGTWVGRRCFDGFKALLWHDLARFTLTRVPTWAHMTPNVAFLGTPWPFKTYGIYCKNNTLGGFKWMREGIFQMHPYQHPFLSFFCNCGDPGCPHGASERQVSGKWAASERQVSAKWAASGHQLRAKWEPSEWKVREGDGGR